MAGHLEKEVGIQLDDCELLGPSLRREELTIVVRESHDALAVFKDLLTKKLQNNVYGKQGKSQVDACRIGIGTQRNRGWKGENKARKLT